MSSLRSQLSPSTADRYLVTWLESDLVESLKRALNVRRFALRLDYTTHTPMLFIRKPDGTEVLWRILDTRKFKNASISLPEKEVDVCAFVRHVDESLKSFNCRLIIGHRRDEQRRQSAMILIVSEDSRHWVLSMISVAKGSSKTVIGKK